MAKNIISKDPRESQINKDQLISLYIDNELSQKDCGVILGVSASTIGKHLKKHGIGSRPFVRSMPGEMNPFYGKKHSKRTKDIIGKIIRCMGKPIQGKRENGYLISGPEGH